MKTTLDGVVFLLPHVSSHAKTEFHSRRIFPGPREEGGNGMRRPGESCRTRTVGRQDEAAEQGGRTERQDGAARRSGKTDRQDGSAGRIGRTERQDGAAGRGGKTGRQDGAAGRSGKTERQDGAARRSGRTGRQDGAAGRCGRKRGGGQSRVIAADRSGGAARTNKKNGIPTAGSRRTAKKRTEKRPGICKRPMHRFSIRCSDTGKGAILSARPPLVK